MRGQCFATVKDESVTCDCLAVERSQPRPMGFGNVAAEQVHAWLFPTLVGTPSAIDV